jgi:hypothetical protein
MLNKLAMKYTNTNPASRGIIYYTDNQLEEPIMSICQKYIVVSHLPIVSCSLKPIDFGQNIVLEGRVRGYPTMVKQIITALENSVSDYVFFCEHDVLYHPSHFDFIPARDDIYYYNVNNWRWDFPKDRAIQYDELTSLSQLCANRKLALNHFKLRQQEIERRKLDKIFSSDKSQWSRLGTYEPGRLKKCEGGFTDEDYEKWRSKYPNIDIRHKWTFTRSKTTVDDFICPPAGWKEIKISKMPGWGNILKMFNVI